MEPALIFSTAALAVGAALLFAGQHLMRRSRDRFAQEAAQARADYEALGRIPAPEAGHTAIDAYLVKVERQNAAHAEDITTDASGARTDRLFGSAAFLAGLLVTAYSISVLVPLIAA